MDMGEAGGLIDLLRARSVSMRAHVGVHSRWRVEMAGRSRAKRVPIRAVECVRGLRACARRRRRSRDGLAREG